jgi:hypothetical protein
MITPARTMIVIARSDSDEAIQFSTRATELLDCFVEFIIGPATSGRTRWLAMTSVEMHDDRRGD